MSSPCGSIGDLAEYFGDLSLQQITDRKPEKRLPPTYLLGLGANREGFDYWPWSKCVPLDLFWTNMPFKKIQSGFHTPLHCVEWVWSDTLLHPFYPGTLFIKKVKMTPFLALHPLYCINFALHPFYFHTGF